MSIEAQILAQAFFGLGSILLMAGLGFDTRAYMVEASDAWRARVHGWANRLTVVGAGSSLAGLGMVLWWV